MIVSMHQPNFLPWLGFFDKVALSDVFVLLDNVQFEKNEWQNRNRIKGPGGPQWLTVPVRHKFPQTISETAVNNDMTWSRKHWNAIVSNYSKAPFFSEYGGAFEEVYKKKWESLVELNRALLAVVFDLLGLQKRIVIASEFPVETTSSQRLSDLCEAVGGDVYLAGAGGHDYLDTKPFEARKIHVTYQDYKHPIYPQLFGAFVSHISVIDLLFNCGDQSLAIIRGDKAV